MSRFYQKKQSTEKMWFSLAPSTLLWKMTSKCTLLFIIIRTNNKFSPHGISRLVGLGVCSLKVLGLSIGIIQCMVLVGGVVHLGLIRVGPNCFTLKRFLVIKKFFFTVQLHLIGSNCLSKVISEYNESIKKIHLC